MRDSDDGESSHEIVSVPKAIAEAKRAGLDLVEVNGKASPPVCRFMDYERVRYDQRKRDKEKKKVQSQMQKRDEVKEIRLTAKIDSHDLNVKINAASRFLDAGYRVTFRIMFKNSDGIAMEKRAARGAEIMHNVMGMLEDYEIVTVPKMIGSNHMSASINRSTKKKSQKEVV